MAGDEAYDSAADRLFRRVEEQADGCWVWTGHVSGTYGRIRAGSGVRVQVHRLSYELLIGPVPAGLQLDHLCRNRLCVNPSHLEPVTPRVNYLRGESPMAKQARQSACVRGHELSGKNLRVKANGKRECRACALAAQRARREANRDLINAQKRDWYAKRALVKVGG